MVYEKIDLYEYFSVSRKGASGGYLTVYAQSQSVEVEKRLYPAVLVIPGGGYGMVSEREAEPVAMRFASRCYQAFVLQYTVNTPHPVPLTEAAMAMVYIRENAEKYGVCKDAVCAVGFSAGGHLAGTLATLFADKDVKAVLKERSALVRPDAVVLSYPVITMNAGLTHGGTMQTISGGNGALGKYLSLEERVTKESAPAFIWHTMADDCVPVENSILLAQAYRKAGVPFELHIFEEGWHGLSVLNERVNYHLTDAFGAEQWSPLAFAWLEQRGFCVKKAE